jgi:hypothetical protein
MNTKLRCPQPHLGAPTLPVILQGGSHRAFTGRRKLPWRYRWPDVTRDDVPARLLALNSERYAEEVALGLHSKGAKQAARRAGPVEVAALPAASGGGGLPRPVSQVKLAATTESRWGWGCEGKVLTVGVLAPMANRPESLTEKSQQSLSNQSVMIPGVRMLGACKGHH